MGNNMRRLSTVLMAAAAIWPEGTLAIDDSRGGRRPQEQEKRQHNRRHGGSVDHYRALPRGVVVSLDRRRTLKSMKGDKGGGIFFMFDAEHDVSGAGTTAPTTSSPVETTTPAPVETTTTTTTARAYPSYDSPWSATGAPAPPSLEHRGKKSAGKKLGMDKIEKPKAPKSTKLGKGKGKGEGKGKGKGKGDGKGKGGGIVPTQSPSDLVVPPTPPPAQQPACQSAVAAMIAANVPEAIVQNPYRCCGNNNDRRPNAVYVTHAQPDNGTSSGFEEFWNAMYLSILAGSNRNNVYFVMTGVDLADSNRTLSEVMQDVVFGVSGIDTVVSMMSTDPTTDTSLMTTIRSISNDAGNLPTIGVFNAGYNNIIIEAIVSGQERLPFVGLLSDTDFGVVAAEATKSLLDGVPAAPLCLNARIGELDFIGERCSAYYNTVVSNNSDPITPEIGVACSVNSTVDDIVALIQQADANAVWTHVDCCAVLADAAEQLLTVEGRNVVTGCQDHDTSSGRVDFVTAQPIELQGYQTAAWATLPVLSAQTVSANGRAPQYFPGLSSLVHTAVYNEIIRTER